MADEIKRGAVRIITDLHDVRATHVRPGANTILRGEHQRDVDALVNADLSLARMLDEFDGKLKTFNNDVFEYSNQVADTMREMRDRIAQLEAQTFGGRVRRFLAWKDRQAERFAAFIVDLVEACDTSVGPRP